MPSVSGAQHGFAAMSMTSYGRAKLRAHGKTPMPEKTAKEFVHADKGVKIGKLARHVKRKS